MIKSIVLCSVFLFICNVSIAFSQQEPVNLKLLGPISNVQFKRGYAYGGLSVNDHYLVWYEGYTHTVYIYNLSQKKVKKVELSQGRGPHEFLRIYGITISDSNVIYLVDVGNIKIIRLKVSGIFLDDQIPPNGRRPEKVSIGSGYIVFSEPDSYRSMFYFRDHHKIVPLGSGDSSEGKIHNSYKLMGYQTIQHNYFIQVREYLPYIYVYNLQKEQLVKKIKFDDSEVEWGKSIHRSNGMRLVYPPIRADIVNRDISRVPGEPHCILLLARGASNHRTYGKNKLFEYNYKKEKFVTMFKLPFRVREITVNDHYLFAYSKQKNKIYRWKIIHSN